jgi:hypothetical protein
MRSLLAVLMNLVVLLAFAQAPIEHVHLHEDTAQHQAAFLHTHFASMKASVPGEPEWRQPDPDSDARFTSWFSKVRIGKGLTPAICAELECIFPAPPPGESPMAVLRPRSHDPPDFGPSIPRAPPL